MRTSSFSGLLVACAFFVQQAVDAQFVAYNDHAPGPGTSPNATTYDVFGNGPGLSGPLKDIKTGATLPVTLTISVSDSGISFSQTQGTPAPGTPLYDAFNGYVDFQGTPNPSIELTAGGLVTYTFTGLNPNKRYIFMGSAVRGNVPYTNRWTLFELAGAVSFTAAHTANVLTNAIEPLISPNQAAIDTGVNSTPETGDMVVWKDIDPGPEGSFAVTCQQYTGPVPNGASDGIKGYGMTGIRLEEVDTAGTPVLILIPPQSQTVEEYKPVTFTVTASGNPPPAYQWYKNDTLIVGATNAIYTLPAAAFTDDNAKFKVIASNTVTNTNFSITSSDAILHVIPDTTPPTLVGAQAIGVTQVRVTFSERVTPETATNVSNYAITAANVNTTISGATLDAAQTTVLLDVSTLDQNSVYTLSVAGVKDQSGTGNPVAPGTQKTFSAIPYTPLDIGVTNVGGIFAVAGGFDVQGGGADIATARDQFQFSYEPRSGDFDIRSRIADLTVTDAYVKGGLMVRETLTDSSRFAAVFASSAQLGSFFESRSATATPTVLAGPTLKFPSSYPWAWLRLRRSGNDFTGFGSFDGLAWQQLGTVNIAMTNAYFGFAVTSGNTNAVATAKFRDVGSVDNPTTFTYKPERESIGPANRRTGIIFSEIMYHPKPRTDGRSMDFVEIYNGEAIFIDLSGWKIAGGIDFTFPDGFKIGAGQFVVVAADPDAIQTSYGISGVLGPYLKNLSDNEDTLKLLNQVGAVRDELTYASDAPWPVAADGAGHSLVCLRPSYGEDDVRAWGASQLVGGSPGFDDPVAPNPWKGVVINEILAAPGATAIEPFIELYNASNTAVDLSGCFITDSPTVNKFTIPAGTRLEARSWAKFTAQQLGFTVSSAGGTFYLVSADQSRVLDAVRIEGQEAGVSVGRAPDGSPGFRRLASITPGQLNAPRNQESIVINEIMYNPIGGDVDDQYIELYNRSSAAVDLSNWRFVSGIDLSIPAGTSIPANGYMVIAHDVSRMLSNYVQLTRANTVGNFSGKLSAGGERLALAKPGATVSEFITVSEVTYMTGGRWPELANGGGSSLELRDAHADTLLAPNWAASDETQKSSWATYEYTGTLTLANQAYLPNKLFIMAQGEGDYLVDEVEVFKPGSTNVVSNPGFETGQTGWNFYGTHRTSAIRTTGAYSGQNCLFVHATEVGDEGPNSIRGALSATLTANTAYTIRAKIRWLSGWPELLMRIRGNGVEMPVTLQIPKNLGTPGLPNSRAVNNAGPAITDVSHYPTIPAANQSVIVTARISDPDAVVTPQVVFQTDPSGAPTTVSMFDDGTGGDELGGDGVYTATIPARASGLVSFYVTAQDGATTSATATFPNDAPTHQGLIRWADPAPFGSFGHYHMWATTASVNDVNTRPGQDRTYRDCSIIYDTRVIYNAGWRNKGSPFHSGVGSYSIGFNDDDMFLGSDKHVFRSTGNGGDESTEMADDVSYWIGEKMGLPFNHARYVRVYRNGALHYRIDYDLEVPDRSIAKDWFGGGGLEDTLYKIAGWFEYDDSNNGGTGSLIWAIFQKKPGTAPPFKTSAYRFNWQSHPGGKTANDYTVLFNLIAGANASDKVTQLMNLADMEEWMRTFAHRRVISDWDSWSYNTGQNMYMYAPLGERARLMSWDMDFVLGLGDGATTANLFSAGEDSIVAALFAVPTYRRMLWRAYQDAANGPLQKAISDPQFDSRQKILGKNNIAATAPTGPKSFVASRRTFLQNQIKTADAAAFSISTADFTTSTSTATITGIAPFGVASIEVNGNPYPVSWATATSWSVRVPLGAVTNTLQIVGKDLRGNIYTNATGQVTVTYTGPIPQASDYVVINELMYNASVPNAEFIEIYNNHPTFAFNLSGYRIKGADFTFPGGTVIQPNGYLVVVKDSASFAAAYGVNIPIVGEYSGRLQNTGETLTLVKPGATAAQDVIIDQVRYANTFPWPTAADGLGPSLQRIDPAQDSWRAGNWGVTAVNDPNRATPGRVNVNRALLNAFPSLWINEIVASNATGATDGAGEHDPWMEIYNAGTDAVDLTLFYLTDDSASPTKWQFPSGTTINPGQFMVVWLDGQPEQTFGTELHANFRASSNGGLIALSRIQSGAPANVDYMYYPGLSADQTYGSIVDGAPENQRLLLAPTPGAANNAGNLIVPVSINEWMASNVRVVADSADGDFEDWFELYNSGATAVDLTDYILSNGTNGASAFKVPFGHSIPAHGFKLVWADNEVEQNNTTNGDLHVNFKLSKAGDSIALFTPTGTLLDAVTYGAQTDNISGGRYPDGAAGIFVLPSPTPLASNVAPSGTRFTRITFDGVQVSLGWRTTVGRTYRVETCSDLTTPAWTAVGNDLTATATTSSVNVDYQAAANRYFRIVQLN